MLLTLDRLPTFRVFTTVYLRHTRLILTEIQTLRWVNFLASGQLEIFVGDAAVTIGVEFVEKDIELRVGHARQAPMLEIELQFISRDEA